MSNKRKNKGKVISRAEYRKRLLQLKADVEATEEATRPKGWKDGDESKTNNWWHQTRHYGIGNAYAELTNMKAMGL